MQSACEAGEVFALLEGGCGGARAAAATLSALYAAVREPWLARGLLAYHARTASVRALDLLARAPDPHARHLLDALLERLRGERAHRHHALAALAPLVGRRPTWLHLLPAHPLVREVLRAARCERDPLPLLHALLTLAALVPSAPALAAAHAAELAEALVRAGGGACPHAALAARALFRCAYATHPCTAVEALRGAGAELGAGAAREAWERAAAALAAGLQLHPALVTGSRRGEAESARWARAEPHDVLAECRRLAPPREAPDAPPTPAALEWRPDPHPPPPGSTAQGARAAGALRPGGEGWFALGERSGAESAPHTPLPADADAAEPEPAVEATPENTPRLAFRFPAEGGAARAIGRRAASPPPAAASTAAGAAPPEARAPDALAARLARVAAERRAADSPVPFGGAPPPAAARPEPLAAGARAEPQEDREVRELTARAAPPADWPEAEASSPRAPDPRSRAPRPAARPAAPGPAARRARSAGPEAGTRRRDADTQTVDTWPEPYEFMIADFYRTPPDDVEQGAEAGSPCERLDAYLGELYAGRSAPGVPAPAPAGSELAEQLALAHAQLMYERWRREAHAERNRRLLGRCRQVRALELHNAALQERVRALTRERDRPARPHPPPPAAAYPPLDAALQEERAARLQAEARLAESEAQRAADAAELQRARGDSFEAARHVEALARAALAAERRADHVRRLRRELLVLTEREARLAEAARAPPAAPPAPPGAERALRAAAARAEAEAEALGARAEALGARAHELESALSAREAALGELKRGARLAAEESAARAQALQDKYAALLRVVRAHHAHDLERLAAAPPAPPAAP